MPVRPLLLVGRGGGDAAPPVPNITLGRRAGGHSGAIEDEGEDALEKAKGDQKRSAI